MYKPRVKICCISSVKEMKLAVKYGASAIGLVSEMPSGPGVISEELIEEIASQTPPGVSTFLLSSKQGVDEIIAQQKKCKTNTIQIVDHLVEGTHKELKDALPELSPSTKPFCAHSACASNSPTSFANALSSHGSHTLRKSMNSGGFPSVR